MEVTVRRGESTTPFSRRALAKSIIRLGVRPLKAYELAEEIRLVFEKEGRNEVTPDEISETVAGRLRAIDHKLERKYRLWRQIGYCEMPIFILIGGGSGVGTTTISAELGYTLGISRVIGTDIIREIMRKTISKEFLPMLHESTYNAWEQLTTPHSEVKDKELLGFRAQAKTVCVGVEALLERSLQEKISMIVEGVHLMPELIDRKYLDKPNVFFFAIDIADEEDHRRRFHLRAKTSARAAEKYLKNFKAIRKIQEYITENARKSNYLVVENKSIKSTVDVIADSILEQMVDVLKCDVKQGDINAR